jgi:hypothetical protein
MRRWQSMWCIATPGEVLQWSFDYSQRRVTWSRSSHACLHKFLTVTTTCFQTRKTLHFRQKYIHDTIFEHNGFLLTGIAFLHTVKYPWQLHHNSLSQMMASWQLFRSVLASLIFSYKSSLQHIEMKTWGLLFRSKPMLKLVPSLAQLARRSKTTCFCPTVTKVFTFVMADIRMINL